jgi:uncharacterized protein YbbC (DUF1343 family)
VALLEQTNVSVGRGTDAPFEQVGAPWIDAKKFSEYMNARKLAEVRFEPVDFTPTSSTLSGKLCHGAKINVVDRDKLDSPAVGIELAAAFLHLYPKQFEVLRMRALLANDREVARLQKGDDPKRIVAGWQRPLNEFRKRRRPYLLYPELR